jgi:hypothetical protein
MTIIEQLLENSQQLVNSQHKDLEKLSAEIVHNEQMHKDTRIALNGAKKRITLKNAKIKEMDAIIWKLASILENHSAVLSEEESEIAKDALTKYSLQRYLK